MTTGDRQFYLPGRVDSYLATLNRLYQDKDEALLREIVVNGVVSIHEGWDYEIALRQPLLVNWTAETWTVRNNELVQVVTAIDTELPF